MANKTFNQLVKAERIRLHYTQKTFSEWAGVSYATYSKWEENKGNMSFNDVIKIATALDLSIDACYGINQGDTTELNNQITILNNKLAEKDASLAKLEQIHGMTMGDNDTLAAALKTVKDRNVTLTKVVTTLCKLVEDLV